MSKVSAPGASIGLDRRRSFALWGLPRMGFFLAFYTLCGVAVLLQLSERGDRFTDSSAGPLSLALNVGMLASLGLVYGWNARAQRGGRPAALGYRASVHGVLALGLLFVLGHMHLAGSQSNPNAILLLAYAFFPQRLLGPRAAWGYLVLGIIGYLGLVWSESQGWIAYAPLHAGGAGLGAHFLNPLHIFVNLLTYALIAGFLVLFLVQSEAHFVEARAEIRRLEELLSMCAHCKKIQNDEGDWEAVEHYVARAQPVSHGICPDCVTLHYADYSP